MEINPYEPPSVLRQTNRQFAFDPLDLILVPLYVVGSLVVSGIGALGTHFICIDMAINIAYQRDPRGFYDEDAISGDELPYLVWHSPILVFIAILCAFALLGYRLLNARIRRS